MIEKILKEHVMSVYRSKSDPNKDLNSINLSLEQKDSIRMEGGEQ